MKVRYLFFVTIIFIILSGCNSTSTSPTNETTQIAHQYLEDQGYIILSHESSVAPYILTKEKLVEIFYESIWQVQSVNPEEYMGKEIYAENFIVKNHPLDDWEVGIEKALGKTTVYVMLADKEVIGGISTPMTEEEQIGCCYSLDGKSIEEVHQHMDMTQFQIEWKEKFGK